MWQRFTERARRVVFFAQEEAGRLGENYISTEHLLLGLVRESDSVAARILDRMKISLGRIRKEIERQVTHGPGKLGQDMQLTPRGKRVIDLAYDEARRLSNNYIGTEHLLLGLIREGEGLAGRVLAKLGVDLERTRKEIKQLQENDTGLAGAKSGLIYELVNQFEALAPEQQAALASEGGMTFADLPETLQEGIPDVLIENMRRATVNLADTSIRIEKNEADGVTRYVLITTPTLRIDLDGG